MGSLKLVHKNKDKEIVEELEFSREKKGVLEKKNGVVVKKGGKDVREIERR